MFNSKTVFLKMKLRALTMIDDGKKQVYPAKGDASIFDASQKEGERLVAIGAAEVVGAVTATLQVDNDDLTGKIATLKAEQLRAGLDALEIGYEASAKKAELAAAFQTACEANPIQAAAFFDSL